jgi:hypothetical protein
MELISLFELTKNPLQPGLLKAALSVLCNQMSPVSYDLAAVRRPRFELPAKLVPEGSDQRAEDQRELQ